MSAYMHTSLNLRETEIWNKTCSHGLTTSELALELTEQNLKLVKLKRLAYSAIYAELR